MTLPDLITIGRTTGIPDVETFVHVSGNAFPQGDLSALPAWPTRQEREANRYQAVAEVTGADGAVVRIASSKKKGAEQAPLVEGDCLMRRQTCSLSGNHLSVSSPVRWDKPYSHLPLWRVRAAVRFNRLAGAVTV